MHVVGHVNNVVNHLGDVTDGETLEVPIGGRGGNPHRLIIGQIITNELQKLQISLSIILVTRRDARDIWGPRIFPVKVDAIESLVLDELDSPGIRNSRLLNYLV